MKKSLLFAASAVLLTLLFSQCNQETASGTATNSDTASAVGGNFGGFETQVKWGEHLVTVGDCGTCHTPKKMSAQGPVDDSALLLSGHPSKMPAPDVNRPEMQSKGYVVTQTLTAWVGPWGISYSANLTPDSTGTGNWTEEQFVYAIRNGKTKGMANARPILPPMPWMALSHMTDDELKAIFAYLRSVKPIQNQVPPPAPPAGS